MPYCTMTDLLAEANADELTKITRSSTGQPDEIRIKTEMQKADEYINATLTGYCNLPFVTTPPLIKDIAVRLTLSYLYEAYYRNGSVPNAMVWAKIDANSLLKKIKDGEIRISGDSASSTIIAFSSDKRFTDRFLDEFAEYRE